MGASIRRATLEDCEILYEWRNDELVRKNSFCQEFIEHEEHIKWLHNFLDDESCRIYILIDDEVKVGQAKVRVIDNEAEIGYSIGKEYRGHGYGTKCLELVKSEIKKEFPNVQKVYGRVKVDNVISERAFEKAGYHAQYVEYVSNV